MAENVIEIPGGDGGITQLTGDGTAGPGNNTQSFTLGITSSKGEIIANDGTGNFNLAAGSSGQVLTADSTETLGLKWANGQNETDGGFANSVYLLLQLIDGGIA